MSDTNSVLPFKIVASEDIPKGTIMLVAAPPKNMHFKSMEELAKWMVWDRWASVIENIKLDSHFGASL